MTKAQETDALQGVLRAEHAAVWGYGVVGGLANPERENAVEQAQNTHRTLRDQVSDLLRARDSDPATAEATYDLPFEVADPVSAVHLAATLEDGVAAAWRYLLGRTDDADLRAKAVGALSDSAVRAVQWRQIADLTPLSTAFPGRTT